MDPFSLKRMKIKFNNELNSLWFIEIICKSRRNQKQPVLELKEKKAQATITRKNFSRNQNKNRT